MENLLFVCNECMHRSPTAVSLFRGSKKYNAKAVGISPFAETQITKGAIKWANKIFVMEDYQKDFIKNNFFTKKEIINLHIPDNYSRNDPELIEILKERLKEYLD